MEQDLSRNRQYGISWQCYTNHLKEKEIFSSSFAKDDEHITDVLFKSKKTRKHGC